MLAVVLSLALAVSPVQIKGTLQDYLRQNYGWPEVQVERLHVQGRIPSGAPERIELLKGPLGRASFLFVYPSGKTLRVRATIRAKDYVLVTTAPVRKGQVPEPRTLARRLMDVQKMPSDVITEPETLEGLRARYNIRAGTLLRMGMFEAEPLVKKGQKVTIVYQKGGLKVTAPGLLRQDGIEGMPVEVLNLATKRILKGVVRKGGVVDVTP